MLLVKLPVPVPSEVLLSDVVGSTDVLQQTPRAVTAAPPSDVISPPLDAPVAVREDTAVVVTVGIANATVVNSTSFYVQGRFPKIGIFLHTQFLSISLQEVNLLILFIF